MADQIKDPTRTTGGELLASLSRRTPLKGTGASALAMLFASPLFSAAANAQTPDKARVKPRRQPPHNGRVTPKATALAAVNNPVYVPPAPFYAEASCNLSQDHFATTQVLIGDGDEVLPYTGPGGVVQAVVRSSTDQTVLDLRRDPTQSSGWSYAVIPAVNDPITNTAGQVTKAAVHTNADGSVYLFCMQQTMFGPGLVAYVLDGNGNWVYLDSYGLAAYTFADDVVLRVDSAPDGASYGYARDTSGTLVVWAMTSSEVTVVEIDSFQNVDVADLWLLWNPEADGSAQHLGYAVVRHDDGTLNYYEQENIASFNLKWCFDLFDDVSDILWAAFPDDPTSENPRVLFQLTSGNVFYSDILTEAQLFDIEHIQVGPGSVASWQAADVLTFAVLDTNGTVNIMNPDPTSGNTYGAAIPLQGGLSTIYCQPSDPDQTTLFAVDVAETLNVLGRDSSGVWSYIPVHRDTINDPSGLVLSEVDSWRVQISLYDGNNNPMAGGQATISADNAVGLWQPTGNTILDGNSATLTADYTGRITFSVPAVELDTTVLHVTPLAPNGTPGTTIDVTPNIDVQQFFSGQVPLQKLSNMSSATLVSAVGTDGTSPFPNLAKSGDPTGTATVFADAFKNIATIGLGQPLPGGTQSFQVDITSTASSGLSVSMATSPTIGTYQLDLEALAAKRSRDIEQLAPADAAVAAALAAEGVSGWFSSVKHDIESVFHALRHEAIKIKTLVANWDADAKNWAINLVVDIGDGLDNAMDYVISDIHSAVHAISNFFNALGADIDKAVDWLKYNVLELLSKADANAQQIQTILADAGDTFRSTIQRIEKQADGWFVSKEDQVHAMFAQLKADFTGTTVGSTGPTPPDPDSSSNTAEVILNDLSKADSVLKYADGQWLWEKLSSYLPSTGMVIPANDDGLDTFADIVAIIEDSTELIEDFGTLVLQALQDSCKSPQDLNNTDIGTLFDDLDNVVEDLLKLADKLVDLLLDLLADGVDAVESMLDLEFTSPFVVKLLELAGISGAKLTTSYILSMIAAFPATLITEILGQPLFPSTAPTSAGQAPAAAHRAIEDPWAFALNMVSMPIQLAWTLIGAYEDVKLGDSSAQMPDSFFFIDILAPLALTALQWPSAPVNGKTPPPLSDPDWGGPDGAMIAPNLVLSLLPALASAAQAFLSGGGKIKIDPNGTLATYLQPVVQTGSGVASIVLSSLWNWANDQSGTSKAIGVLGEISYATGILGTNWVGDATDGGSYAVKTVGDALANTVTAGLYFANALDATSMGD
jgi:hypothetical protein